MVIALVNRIPIYRRGVSFFLKSEFAQGAVIVEAESVSSLESGDFDVIIFSIEQVPESQVMADIHKARKCFSSARLILVGKEAYPALVIDYFSAGIAGYVDSGAALSELAKCVEDVSAGKKFVSQDLFWKLLKVREREETDSGKVRRILTGREFRIAKYLSEGRRTSWIATQLNLKSSTVSTVKATIFKKLDVDDVIRLKAKIDSLEKLRGGRGTEAIAGS